MTEFKKNVAGVCGTYGGTYYQPNAFQKKKKNTVKDNDDDSDIEIKEESKEEEVSVKVETADAEIPSDESNEDISEMKVEEYVPDTTDASDNVSEEEIEEPKEAAKSNKAKIHNITDDNTFNSMAEAERFYNLPSGSVSSAIKNDTEIDGMKFEKL